MTHPVPQSLVTIADAMATLELNRQQVSRLIGTNLLPSVGYVGRTQLVDPAALTRLAGRRWLPAGGPDAEFVALALHLGPLDVETDPNQGRQLTGWHATKQVPDNAWTGWWNTGAALADECVERNLPLVLAVSGIIVDVRSITGWTAHPHYRDGGVRFDVAPSGDSGLRAFQGARFHPAAGTPWQRLKH